jgi:hypothetical protein
VGLSLVLRGPVFYLYMCEGACAEKFAVQFQKLGCLHVASVGCGTGTRRIQNITCGAGCIMKNIPAPKFFFGTSCHVVVALVFVIMRFLITGELFICPLFHVGWDFPKCHKRQITIYYVGSTIYEMVRWVDRWTFDTHGCA